MKQIITNPLRAFTLAVSFLFAISLSAVEVEIDGINYDILVKAILSVQFEDGFCVDIGFTCASFHFNAELRSLPFEGEI